MTRSLSVWWDKFCQALGVPPERKYSAEGGPTFPASFDLLRRVTARPAVATLTLLDAAIFNLIVGNADAHGKNFSLLYDGVEARLAPLYDLLSTVSYPDLSPKLAMKMGKRATLDEMGRDTWPNFAKEIGMGAPFVRRRVRELSEAARARASGVVEPLAADGLDVAALSACASRVVERAERVGATA